jgi:glucosamine--fructose-6-phosphate aminotransferase (isomerizing)
MIEGGSPVLLLAAPGRVCSGMLQLARHLSTLKAETVVISSEEIILEAATRRLRIPDPAPDLFSLLPCVIPGQIFAAMLAETKGLSPDKPSSFSRATQTV